MSSNTNIRKMTKQDKQAVIEMMRVFYTSPAVFSNGSENIFLQDIYRNNSIICATKKSIFFYLLSIKSILFFSCSCYNKINLFVEVSYVIY